MGQAKRRGDFEKRKLEAIERQKQEMLNRKLEQIEREKNMTPEERENLRKQKEAFSYFSSITSLL